MNIYFINIFYIYLYARIYKIKCCKMFNIIINRMIYSSRVTHCVLISHINVRKGLIYLYEWDLLKYIYMYMYILKTSYFHIFIIRTREYFILIYNNFICTLISYAIIHSTPKYANLCSFLCDFIFSFFPVFQLYFLFFVLL